MATRAPASATTFPSRNPVVPENGQWQQVLDRGGEDSPSARETHHDLATPSRPPFPEIETLDLEQSEIYRTLAFSGAPARAKRGRVIVRCNAMLSGLVLGGIAEGSLFELQDLVLRELGKDATMGSGAVDDC